MKEVKRYENLKDESFDSIIMRIKYGKIKCGKYSNLIKFKPKEKIKTEGRLFSDESGRV